MDPKLQLEKLKFLSLPKGEILDLPRGTQSPHSSISTNWENRHRELTKEDKVRIGLLNDSNLGLKSIFIQGKGRGVVAKKDFKVNDFIVEYKGNLMSRNDGLLKDKEYSRMNISASYMFFFQDFCIDATEETKELGRLINHSRKNANLKPISVKLNGRPRLAFIASKEIKVGDEILFDYNDNRPKSVQNFPFLKE